MVELRGSFEHRTAEKDTEREKCAREVPAKSATKGENSWVSLRRALCTTGARDRERNGGKAEGAMAAARATRRSFAAGSGFVVRR